MLFMAMLTSSARITLPCHIPFEFGLEHNIHIMFRPSPLIPARAVCYGSRRVTKLHVTSALPRSLNLRVVQISGRIIEEEEEND